ncbi:hypothetical protein A2982_00195 [candidate division WWE3 bacterium RIFCSPLOWO2_01_FULL_39_13]|uniref:Diacylglycerol kinase n=1 Tax=candidate division WWE3 bacterium RIFCSPLOWO2_01_FULL_39_13 TaxID=1802624 RepID=A0A1F4V4B0_UNCKA|nr:MAG: hypothetical protein A2982_00195 [candidate division WWE3 bacterium RIFCSPLOWO2_01_FULL_39_13]
MPDFKSIEPVKYDRKKHDISFQNAFNGILLAFKTQPNFRFHMLFFILATLLGIVYQITVYEYLAILVISTIVMAMEMVNTAVEAIGDEISGGKFDKLIGVAKDVSAGGVLIAAIGSILIGFFIFFPKIYAVIVSGFVW